MNRIKHSQSAKPATANLPVDAVDGGSHIDAEARLLILKTTTQDALADVLEHFENHGLTMAQMAQIAQCSQSALSKFRRNQMAFTAARTFAMLHRIDEWRASLNDVPYRRSRN